LEKESSWRRRVIMVKKEDWVIKIKGYKEGEYFYYFIFGG
jgi:hypothetical protein